MILCKKVTRFQLIALFIFIVNTCCSQSNATLFKLLPPASTGINFTNTIFESDTLNILNQANVYNGGGVGIGDFNNDGLMDIYFAANMTSNKLYLNKGAMKFEDITDVSGVGGGGKWCTGVSVVDINADGLSDIYVSSSFYKDATRRRNLLYINQGNNKDGIPVFKESAETYEIADSGFSTQGYFFDYDHDGDLDLYLVTNELYDPKTPIKFRPKVVNGTALNTDRLYRNNGNNTFTNVSKEAGILIEGWGHAACISDFNMDGWPDVYVANDFVSNDLLYINNKNGTFTNRLGEYFKHTGWNAMGTDVVDINNDGLADIVSLEMLPEDNLRKKRMFSGNEYYNYTNSARYAYTHQYVRNVLQLNSGMTSEGHPVFNDIGFMAGIYQTDWSWCPLIADFDNDGYRDMIITNGLPRDVTDLDYIVYNNGQGGKGGNLTLAMTDSLPVVKLPNYAFKNKGGFMFENTTDSWGLNLPSFSNGAAYADLDNDGDLDIVINNINGNAFVYENTLNNKDQHTLSVKFEGSAINTQGIGANVRIYYSNNQQQFYEHQPCRGYLSTDDARAHFGVGDATVIDSFRVVWPDGKSQLMTGIQVNQLLTISYKNASENKALTSVNVPIFKEVSKEYSIKYKPQEKEFIDYNIQPTMPHKLSQYGPGIAVGDVDSNGFDDIFISAASEKVRVFFMQDAKGNFVIDSTRLLPKENELGEDMGTLLFDADKDGDMDLYVVSGSYEIPPNHAAMQDRLYLNNGKGKFQLSVNALPKMVSNKSCVRAADFDGDGDLDLFVGGRVVSGSYPTAPQSYILMNQGGKFTDVTQQYCPQLQHIGMITDALWSDFDKDGKADLIIAGEWMPITFLKNTGKAFINVNKSTGIDQHIGWFNSLVSGDFDNDGDIDYIAGNLGLNSNYKATPEEPMTLYAKDIDQNGLMDAMVFCYMKAQDGTKKLFPMATRDDMISQLIATRKKFPTYKAYGLASIDEMFSKQDLQNATMLIATDLNSSYIRNDGNGKFTITALPLEAQAAPVFGMVSRDIDGDGNLDVLMVGNDYSMEPYSGRHDAFMGLYLKGDGKGDFTAVPVTQSGFFVNGDAKALAVVHTAKNEDIFVATQNQDSIMVYGTNQKNATTSKWINLQPTDFFAEVTYADNTKKRIEFYYGSTFISQSSRKVMVDNDVIKIIITDYKGTKREVFKK